MNKFLKLFLCVILDAIGYLSFVIPGIGEFSDIIWAPVSGFLMTKLFKGKAGKVGGIIAFAEEALPFTDVVPTFTIMWAYTHLIKSKTSTKTLK